MTKNRQHAWLHERAEASAKYLAEKQWAPATQKIGGQPALEYVHNYLHGKRGSNSQPNIEVGPITLGELQRTIRKMKRPKAHDPDNYTSDWPKDLDEDV